MAIFKVPSIGGCILNSRILKYTKIGILETMKYDRYYQYVLMSNHTGTFWKQTQGLDYHVQIISL